MTEEISAEERARCELAQKLVDIAKAHVEGEDPLARLASFESIQKAVDILPELGSCGLLGLADLAKNASEDYVRLRAISNLEKAVREPLESRVHRPLVLAP
jgi:hypothetical protein